ncbi:MAG: phosphatidate cytidylyltransferase [Phycisphaerales bacterium]
MVRRLILGPILIGVLLLVIWGEHALAGVSLPAFLRVLARPDGSAPPGLILLPLGCLVAARAAIELGRIYKAAGLAAPKRVIVLAAITGVIVGAIFIAPPADSWIAPFGGQALATAAAGVIAIALLVHLRHGEIRGACGAAGAALMAFVYSGVILGFIMAIRVEFSAWVLLAVILTAKSCDIGAYFTGRLIGRHKLIPWVSPGKTWEGLVGGMIVSGLVGMLGAFAQSWWSGPGAPGFIPGFPPLHGFIAGVLLGLSAQIGDLSASVLKRDAGIKDSGRLLPGMGGIIDVIDSLLLAGPVAFWYLSIVKRSAEAVAA